MEVEVEREVPRLPFEARLGPVRSLGHPAITLMPSQKAECEFDVSLHLGAGTYYLGVYLYRYDTEHEYDHVFPTTSFVMTTDRGAQGVANLYPEVAAYEVMPLKKVYQPSFPPLASRMAP